MPNNSGILDKLYKSDDVVSMIPSKIGNAPYLWVYNPRLPKSKDDLAVPDDLPTIWNDICAKGHPTLSDINNIAVQFNILSGKWLVFVSPDKVDNLWERIVESTLAGGLGDRAKISTRRPGAKSSDNHVIWVYNTDYRSVKEVLRVRAELRRLGVKESISYKPDIYTLLGIHTNNNFFNPPSS